MTITSTITLIAALIAAVFSVVNIVLTTRFTRETETTRWMRTEGRLLFAKLLAASTQHSEMML